MSKNTLYQQQLKKKLKKLDIALIITTAAVVLTGGIAAALYFLILPDVRYQDAVQLYIDGDYAAALKKFETMGDYKKTQELMTSCQYALAMEYYEDGDMEEAASIFEELHDYKDAEVRLEQCTEESASLETTESETQVTETVASSQFQTPNFIGLELEDAITLAEYYGFEVETLAVESSAAQNTVVAQSIAKDEWAESGAAIELLYSKGTNTAETTATLLVEETVMHQGNLILVNQGFPCAFTASDITHVTLKSILDAKSELHYTAGDWEMGLDSFTV